MSFAMKNIAGLIMIAVLLVCAARLEATSVLAPTANNPNSPGLTKRVESASEGNSEEDRTMNLQDLKTDLIVEAH